MNCSRSVSTFVLALMFGAAGTTLASNDPSDYRGHSDKYRQSAVLDSLLAGLPPDILDGIARWGYL